MRPVLLDTCAVIWLGSDGELAAAAVRAIDEAAMDGGVFVSPISAWEIGLLTARGRLRLSAEPVKWWRRLTDTGVQVAPLSPDILIASSYLPAPNEQLRDPADRIIAATARDLDMRIVSRDSVLLDYTRAGNIDAIAC